MIRAGHLGLPVALAIIGGDPSRFTVLANQRLIPTFSEEPSPIVTAYSPSFLSGTSQSDGQATVRLSATGLPFCDQLPGALL